MVAPELPVPLRRSTIRDPSWNTILSPWNRTKRIQGHVGQFPWNRFPATVRVFRSKSIELDLVFFVWNWLLYCYGSGTKKRCPIGWKEFEAHRVNQVQGIQSDATHGNPWRDNESNRSTSANPSTCNRTRRPIGGHSTSKREAIRFLYNDFEREKNVAVDVRGHSIFPFGPFPFHWIDVIRITF